MPVIVALLFAVTAGCGNPGDTPRRGFERGKLPEKFDHPKPGRASYIEPKQLIDTLNAGAQLQIYFIEDVPPPEPLYVVHLPGMNFIQYGEVFSDFNKRDKSRPYYFICLYGDDSKRAAENLVKDGFTSYYLDGGSFRLVSEMRKHGWSVQWR